MKTRTISYFDNQLRKNGFTFSVTKELKDETYYEISKDGYRMSFIAMNVCDDRKANFKLFELNWGMAKRYKDKTGDWIDGER